MIQNKAFTLIELVVTMAIISIIFVISVPIFSEFQSSSRLKSASQTLEIAFGEAFSSSRSRPSYFILDGESDLLKYKECSDSCTCDNKINSRKINLNSGVKFRKNLHICFTPPFGDIELSSDNKENDESIIEIYNKNSVYFKINKESGLIFRISNPEKDE